MAMTSRQDVKTTDAPREDTTPNPDMQPEDAGTAASGNDEPDEGSARASERVMKQSSKTPHERDR